MYKGVPIDIKARSNKELVQKVEKRKQQIDKQTVDPDMRLRDFCFLYLETYKKPNVSASWYADLRWIADKLVKGIGNKPVGRIKPIEVQNFLNSCSDYSDSSIKKIYNLTKKLFEQLMINGATEYRFNLTAPKGRKQDEGKSLTAHEQDVLLNVIKGHRGELFVLIMFYCGLRPSEVSALIWKDIDLKRNVLTVNKAVKKNGAVGGTKSAAGVREVPIPTTLSTVLKEHRKSPFSLVCEQRNGYHTKSSLRKMWASIKTLVSQELGYEFTYRLYDIRHTYCTNLEKQGVPINIASRLMGHSDISITSKIYTHASEEAIEIARRCIEAGNSAGNSKIAKA
jgi:integrase